MSIDFFKDTASDVVLEVEVNPSRAAAFERSYQDITGSSPILGIGYQHQPNKWGAEYRIYFNTSKDILDEFATLDINVEQAYRPYREQWECRVNNSDFFWNLVRDGYRLGKN